MTTPESLPPLNRGMAMSRLLAMGVSGQGAQQLLSGMPLSDPRDRALVSGLLLRVLAAEPGARMAEFQEGAGDFAVRSASMEPGGGKVSSRMIAENY
jgi:hypothetical protein